MDIEGRIAVVTGGGSGIGAALAQRFVDEGAAGVLVSDRCFEQARAVAERIGPRALPVRCDVSREADIQAMVSDAQCRFGRVDIYVSNAGILGPSGGVEIGDEVWNAMWQIHAMAHVWAARAVVPGMLARGAGYFLITASAAGLLNIVETAPYAVTKHAAVGLAEWLRIAYGRRGLRVSCLCPQSVSTPMIAEGAGSAAVNGVITPQEVARTVVETMLSETFLCLPHPEVAGYVQKKAADYDRWLGGMQKMHARHLEQQGAAAPARPGVQAADAG